MSDSKQVEKLSEKVEEEVQKWKAVIELYPKCEKQKTDLCRCENCVREYFTAMLQ